MIIIPSQQDKKFTQTNKSDLIGNTYVTKNITFDDEGYLRLSNACPAFFSEDLDANFDTVAVFQRCDDYGYFSTGREDPFEIDEFRPYAVKPTAIVTAGVPAGDIESDAAFFGAFMVVSQDTDVDYYSPAANTWTDTNITLDGTNTGQHPVVHFASLNALAIGNLTTVLLYAYPFSATPSLFSSGGVSSTMVLPDNLYVTGMTYFNDNLYVGTWNKEGGMASLYVWDGTGTAAQSVYQVNSVMIFDVETYMDSVVVATGSGELLRFNGSGFTLLGAIPTHHENISMVEDTNIDNYKNSLKANKGLLYWAFNTDATSYKINEQPDGIWCYDPKVGLYHRYAFSNTTAIVETIATTSVNTTTDVITVTDAPITGTEVMYYENGTTIGGIVNGQKYYIIYLTATTISLATTLAEAEAGTAIDLTGTGTTGQILVWFPRTDFGQKYLERGGVIYPYRRIMDEPWFGTDLLWGGDCANRAASTKSYMGTTSTVLQNRGYFITPKIFSQAVTDTFNQVSLKFSKFTDEADKIIIKYRTYDDMNEQSIIGVSTPATWLATWTSTTTFTTTEVKFATAVVGDEVEFVKGGGSGYLAHITTISEASGTYTVTLDEAYPYYVTGDKSYFQVRNWKKWKTIEYGDSNALQYFFSEQLGEEGKFIQFKIELRGVRVRIEELLVDNVTLLSGL